MVDSFKLAYEDRKFKNIVLYGTGIHAQAIVSDMQGYNIIGLLDAEKTGETIWGLPVLSLEETLARKADFIVLAARPAVYGIIYTRIQAFTEKYNIPVYDVSGNLIKTQLKNRIKDNQYFEISENDLLTSIQDCQVVSFDIFDTLLMRKVLYPRDIFLIMDRILEDKHTFCFSSERMMAERELSVKGSPSIRDIYSSLARKWRLSQHKIEYLLKLELELEKKTLVPRNKMVDIYEKCLKMGKRIYLVSDMYLPSDMLAELLEIHNIKSYEKIIVSCEYGCEKRNGLFGMLKKELGNKRCIHIGDNIEADIKPARQYGLDSFHVMSGRELLEISEQEKLLIYTDRLEHRIVLGLYIAKAFNNPFILYHSKGKLHVGTELQPGYLFFGPIILAFINWLTNQGQVTAKDCMEYVVFCAAACIHEKKYTVFQYYDFFETVLKYFISSFCSFDKKYTLKFFQEKQSKDYLLWVKKVGDEILEYVSDFAKIYPKDVRIELECAVTILVMTEEQYSVLDPDFRKLLCT